MTSENPTIAWLLKSDVAIQWQVMRDLLDAPEAEWSPVRSRVEHEGWGKELLSHQDEDGRWAGGCFVPPDTTREEWQSAQPWTATYPSLSQLREFGLDPESARTKKTVHLIGKSAQWDEGNQPFWEGEVEECINGQTVANGAYFGVDVSGIVNRLLGERQEDGGWNCERAEGSVRSSFATTINVLEGFLEYERTTGNAEVRKARKSAEEYLLKRHLFKRLTTGEPADEQFLKLLYPTRWRYDVLRALDYFRAASRVTGDTPDGRLKEAVEVVRSKRRDDGTWAAEWEVKGRVWFRVDEGVGTASPWITLRALRVLKWWDENN
ncbi:prenyltransferase-like domain-containing protein [Pochonia chlamydosporia 170]|uniref:Prenyltransferase-like domain-containing protein n=1 Tax=Pochonia chlamydosporia 170 TaxID=1380566 RepID=A0A179G083_METCM|nr:prenyltransferase-like domain-containing protein [Pochonia chlamydosporia 170]OAQ70771.1 prenyltransferase-like domain-containing protein [Pochonia chlamydosporia 170]